MNYKAAQLRIDLKGSKPLIWRRVSVPMDFTFAQLHEVIQIVFGWQDEHLYEFHFDQENLVLSEEIDEDIVKLRNDKRIRLAEDMTLEEQLQTGKKFRYIYDFGDWWEHMIKVEKISERTENEPKLIKWSGENARENCGGIAGYYEILERLKQSDAKEHEELRAWYEEEYIQFDEEDVREDLYAIRLEADLEEELLDLYAEPYVEAMMDLEEVFDFVPEDTLFEFQGEKQTQYIWFHDGELTRSIRVFDNAYSCALACVDLRENEWINPLFIHGIIFDYPFQDEELKDLGGYTYQCYGRAFMEPDVLNRMMKSLSGFLMDMLPQFEDIDMFPDFNEDQMVVRIDMRDQENVSVEFIESDLCLDIERASVSQEQIDQIRACENKDQVYLMLDPVPNMLHDEVEDDLVFVLILKGNNVEELHYFQQMDMKELGELIVDHLFSYMKKYGLPERLYCDDERVRQILQDVCRKIRLTNDFKRINSDTAQELSRKAILSYNPPELFDPTFMNIIDEAKTTEKSDDEMYHILHKIKRYIAYITYLDDEEIDVDLGVQRPIV